MIWHRLSIPFVERTFLYNHEKTHGNVILSVPYHCYTILDLELSCLTLVDMYAIMPPSFTY